MALSAPVDAKKLGIDGYSQTGCICHGRVESLSGGSVEFEFIWQAPAAPGPYTLSVAGNAVNEDDDRCDLDDWAFGNDLQIIVLPPTPARPPLATWAGLLFLWGWSRRRFFDDKE